jgi:hypothetical protein
MVGGCRDCVEVDRYWEWEGGRKGKERRSGHLSSRWAGEERQISRDGKLDQIDQISHCKSGSGDGFTMPVFWERAGIRRVDGAAPKGERRWGCSMFRQGSQRT